jgi:competence protein ComEA
MKEFVKENVYIILGAALILAVGAIFIFRHNVPGRPGGELLTVMDAGQDNNQVPGASGTNDTSQLPDSADSPAYVVVHIVGEVYAPGVFTLPASARVTDAVELAGGYTAYADLFRVNLAAPVHDAKQIVIPAFGDYSVIGAGAAVGAAGSGTALSATPDDGLICLNTATASMLQTIPGIGNARAASIINHRNAIGSFSAIEELMDIPGIGQGILNNMRPFITIR